MSLFNDDIFDAIPSKRCRKCGERKPRAEFSPVKRGKDGLNLVCRACERTRNNQPKIQTKFRTNKTCGSCKTTKPIDDFPTRSASRDARANTCTECVAVFNRTRTLRIKYNLSREQYNQIYERQNGMCAICGRTDSGMKHAPDLLVDHDHSTGENRGLLCCNCNAGIGQFKDDPALLTKAIVYLNQHQK